MKVCDPEDASRAEAEWMSRDCERCGGEGLAPAFHPRYNGSAVLILEDPERGRRQIAARVSAHCVCAIGRWMRHRTEGDMRRRIPDLRDVLDGRSSWLADEPPRPEPVPVRRIPDPVPAPEREPEVAVMAASSRAETPAAPFARPEGWSDADAWVHASGKGKVAVP